MLKQRTWAIMIRPYYIRSGIRLNYDGVPKASDRDTLASSPRGYAVDMLGNGEGGGNVSEGGWTMWYKGTSFRVIREKVKELLKETTEENLMVIELVGTDTLITPMS